jgi:hypothetical protein
VTPLRRELFGSSVALGSNVAVDGSSGKYLTTAPILVVEPFLVSLKVVPSMEEASISSEKKAVTLAVGETSVALVSTGQSRDSLTCNEMCSK